MYDLAEGLEKPFFCLQSKYTFHVFQNKASVIFPVNNVFLRVRIINQRLSLVNTKLPVMWWAFLFWLKCYIWALPIEYFQKNNHSRC